MKAFNDIFGEMMEDSRREEFFTLTNRFRVYTNPEKGLVELEELDDNGQMIDCTISHTFAVFGYSRRRKLASVWRFQGLLERWLENFEGDLTLEDAARVFNSICELVNLSFCGDDR
jgi:hypothetical protein